MGAYFYSLQEAASSAVALASQAAPVTYELASGQVTVTPQHSAFIIIIIFFFIIINLLLLLLLLLSASLYVSKRGAY